MMEHGGPVRVGSERENRHSRMGIASFVISILSTVLVVTLFIIAAVIGASAFGNVQDPQSIDPQSLQDSPALVGLAAVGLGMLASIAFYLLGLGLGVAGIIQRRRKRFFAVLGAIFNGIVLLLIVGLVAFGFVASQGAA
jgi:hypothetical protein